MFVTYLVKAFKHISLNPLTFNRTINLICQIPENFGTWCSVVVKALRY